MFFARYLERYVFFARYLERYVFFARYLERYVFCLVLCALWLESCGVHLLPKRGSPLCFFLHSSGREELDSLPIVLELENTLWFSNSCLQLGTNSFAGIVLELCMDRELVAKMGEPIPIFYTLVWLNWFELSVKVDADESVPVSLPTIYFYS